MNDWFKCNKLFLNYDKTKYVIFHTKKKIVPNGINPIQIANVPIERTQSVFFLGIHIADTLDWKYHVDHVYSKISRTTGIMAKLKHFLPRTVLMNVYNAIILPHLNYCNIVWGNTYKTKLTKIFYLQKRLVRLISNRHYLSPSIPLFSKLKIIPIFDLIKLNTSTFMFKFHKQLLPPLFGNMFQINSSVHNYHTRQCNNLHHPLFRSTSLSNSILYVGVREWNLLDYDMTSSSTITKFKTLFKKNIYEKLCQQITSTTE